MANAGVPNPDSGMPNPEMEGLRDEIGKLRKEMADFRIERAAKHLEHMRNWMGIYTPTVTGVFLLFALLGFRGLSDIQNNKEKFEATSGQAAKLLADVTVKFESIKKEDEGFRGQIAANEKVVQQNKTVLVGFKSDLSELERKHGELKTTEAQLTADLTGLRGKVQELTATSKSSLALTTGIGDILSTSLNVPIITSLFVSLDGGLTIQGIGFGSGGKVLMSYPPPLSGLVSLSSLAGSSVEFPDPMTWSDTSIVCGNLRKVFTDTFHEDFYKRKSAIGIQVEVNSGVVGPKYSNVYSILPAPAPPSLIKTEVQ
jgi:hypothetical protein